MPEWLLREIATQMASGLEAIHAQGIVRRDLEPDNVLQSQHRRRRERGRGATLGASVPAAHLEN